jgi:Uma2 family endonuclease
VLLVVEVSDTSLEYDRKTKLPLYAAAGIAEAWIVDLAAGRLEVYSQPRGGLYTRSALYGREDTIASTAVSELTVPVSGILG